MCPAAPGWEGSVSVTVYDQQAEFYQFRFKLYVPPTPQPIPNPGLKITNKLSHCWESC